MIINHMCGKHNSPWTRLQFPVTTLGNATIEFQSQENVQNITQSER